MELAHNLIYAGWPESCLGTSWGKACLCSQRPSFPTTGLLPRFKPHTNQLKRRDFIFVLEGSSLESKNKNHLLYNWADLKQKRSVNNRMIIIRIANIYRVLILCHFLSVCVCMCVHINTLVFKCACMSVCP